MRSRCLVLFDARAATVTHADLVRALEEAELDVVDQPGGLDVSWGEPPDVRVRLLEADEARRQVGLADRAGVLGSCDSCVAIEIADLDEALDEANLLIEVQATLEELTGGWVYNEWNGVLSREGETIE